MGQLLARALLVGLVGAAACWPTTAWAAVAFDATSSASTALAVASLSWTHTPVGTPSLVVVGVSVRKTSPLVTSVTYGATGMTQIRVDTSLNEQSYLFQLVSPPTGAQTVTVNVGAGNTGLVGGAVTVTGSDLTTPISNNAGAFSNGPTTAVTVTVTSAAGELVIDTMSSRSGGSATVGAGQTQQWNLVPANVGAGSTAPGAATVTMSWTLGVAAGFAQSAASIKATAAAAPPSVPERTKMGVGL